MRSLRIAALALSIAVCAWFVLGIHQDHDVNAASAIVSGATTPSAAQARQARSLLERAKLLNPDSEVDLLRAQLDLEQGNQPGARAILERVVAREPDNAVAWEWLARASVGDLREFYLAAFRIEQLVPPVRTR